MGCHNLLGRYGKVFVMEDQFLDYVTVFATAVVCFVISLCFGWNFVAALLFGSSPARYRPDSSDWCMEGLAYCDRPSRKRLRYKRARLGGGPFPLMLCHINQHMNFLATELSRTTGVDPLLSSKIRPSKDCFGLPEL